jgi:hypothetical protein
VRLSASRRRARPVNRRPRLSLAWDLLNEQHISTQGFLPMQTVKKLMVGAILSIAAASSMATTIYSQDFSKGLQANETLTGKWSISNGKLTRGPYDAFEHDTFIVSLDLSGYTDIHLSYDFWIDSERNWDALELYTRDSLNRTDRIHYATGASYTGVLKATLPDNIKFLEFSFNSDRSIQGQGVYVDNILITGTSLKPTPAPVPEPGPVALMGIGLAALLWRRRLG